ncbi:hypothetical protein [Verrucomicrobium sp. BvORR106]|uniref:hypothetical protein n=1 Tax=Verrucomicrobium sp. BvORR106 TaxID=1403819 RepID=UPI000B0055C3|nr:hypothetical protein [Verrucomicrobium sp. BvORR106]
MFSNPLESKGRSGIALIFAGLAGGHGLLTAAHCTLLELFRRPPGSISRVPGPLMIAL